MAYNFKTLTANTYICGKYSTELYMYTAAIKKNQGL